MRQVLFALMLTALATPVVANPVDLTGMACSRATKFGTQIWEFYGDVAIRYHTDDPSVSRMQRVGEGAYERYNKEGEWRSVYYFFDSGAGLHLRILSTPGLIVTAENPNAPLENGVFPFLGECKPLWEQ